MNILSLDSATIMLITRLIRRFPVTSGHLSHVASISRSRQISVSTDTVFAG
jgi:hypothetical protein